MFERRVAHHFHEAGWTVETSPTLEGPDGPFRPDLLIEKGGRRKAVLVRSEYPPGPFEVAKFGAACRKLKIKGIVVAPDDLAMVDLYDQAGVEFVPGESIGDVVVVGHAPPPPPMAVPRVEEPVPVVAPTPSHLPVGPSRAWRWAVVALIWAVALAVVGYDVWLLLR